MYKIDFALCFIDAKILLIVWILFDLYRNTMLVDSLGGHTVVPLSQSMSFVWENAGSPYLIYIPLAALADVGIKRLVKKMMM
jgi:hypothetical protein